MIVVSKYLVISPQMGEPVQLQDFRKITHIYRILWIYQRYIKKELKDHNMELVGLGKREGFDRWCSNNISRTPTYNPW